MISYGTKSINQLWGKEALLKGKDQYGWPPGIN